MFPSVNPQLEVKGREHPTPTKARIQGTIKFLESQGIKGKKEEVFQFNGVSHRTGYRLLNSDSSRTHHYIAVAKDKGEPRGRKKKITPA